jgi:D-alanyl-D-alanine dipeptidase
MKPKDVQICECRDDLVDIRVVGGINFGPPPECPETEPDYCLVRREVYRKLLRVQDSLPAPYRLRLYEGLRSHGVQSMLFEQEKQRVRARYPHLLPEAVHDEATILVSPVVRWDGTMNIPPHSTGGAVDVEVVDGDGKVLDYGMEIKDWSVVAPELCTPNCMSLSDTAKRNRALLTQLMVREDFVPYEHEWWHFSYGDQYWAYYRRRDFALYGKCTPEMIALARAGANGSNAQPVDRVDRRQIAALR